MNMVVRMTSGNITIPHQPTPCEGAWGGMGWALKDSRVFRNTSHSQFHFEWFISLALLPPPTYGNLRPLINDCYLKQNEKCHLETHGWAFFQT